MRWGMAFFSFFSAPLRLCVFALISLAIVTDNDVGQNRVVAGEIGVTAVISLRPALIVWVNKGRRAIGENDQVKRPPPETSGGCNRRVEILANRQTAQRGGGSMQRS